MAQFASVDDLNYELLLQHAASVLEHKSTGLHETTVAACNGPELQMFEANEPHVLLAQRRFCVLWKPSGWAVPISYSSLEVEEPHQDQLAGGTLLLQDWVAQRFGMNHPIALDQTFGHGFIHRLDRETSGAILWASCYSGHTALRLQLVSRRIGKEYVALCHGHLSSEPRCLNQPLLKISLNDGSHPYSIVAAHGLAACTELLEVTHLVCPAGSSFSLVKIRLHTGRLHQIRAHLSNENHPLVCDGLYGGSAPRWCSRLFLHARCLRVNAGDGLVLAQTALPRDLVRALQCLSPANAHSRGDYGNVAG